MKKVLLALFISTLLIYGSIQASAAQLSFSNVQITPGSNSVMDLSISETDRHYSGVNIAFTLPEGVTVTNITNGALLPAEKYSVEFNAYTTGGAKVVVYSPNDTFSTDGKLLQIELSADASAIPGNYNIEFEANSSTLINSSHAISGQSGVTSVAHDVSVGLLTINNGDSDNDQMKDSWEIANFGNLDQTGTIDSDNDGLTDLQE
ncbi:MAG: hypothetical protein GY760_13320, partial [Deltaproteobacteria bacterium]|nr:hypothetical protein [Deltaproteobacteria bacterium]